MVAGAAGQKKAPLAVSWSYCHMAFSCSLNNISQHVTFKTVEKDVLGGCTYMLRGKPYAAP